MGLWFENAIRVVANWWRPTYPVFATGLKSPVPQGTRFYVRPFLWVIFWLRTLIWRDAGTLSKAIDAARFVPRNFRKPFLAAFIPRFRGMPKYHSHRLAASERSGVNTSMVDGVKAVGYVPFIVSPGAELVGDEAALRLFYTLKDCNKELRFDELTGQHAFVLTDCDYYADVNDLLKGFRPMVIYTFAPVRAGGSVLDGTFFFLNDEVKYLISGGSSYQHKLWDYAGADGHVAVESHDRSLLVYDLEIREVGEDGCRRVIVLSPSALIRYPYWTASFAPKPLQRLDPTVNGIALIRTTIDGTDCVSMARNGIAESVSFPTSLLYVAHSRYVAASKPERSMITRVLLTQKGWFEADGSAELATALLWECFSDMDKFLKLAGRWMAPTSRIPIEEPIPRGAQHFQATAGDAMEDGDTYARKIHAPLVTNPAVFPAVSVNNDKACIADRLERVRNDKVPPPNYDKYWAEFNRFIVPDAAMGSLAPLSIGEVDELQSLPAQRARTAREWPSLGLPVNTHVSSFQKKESYGKAGAPRNISTLPTAHTLGLSSFTLAFKKQFLKPLPWYAPSKTPTEVAQRIQDIALKGDGLIAKDLSRQDGTISGYLNDKYRDCMVRAFGSEYADELVRLLNAERGAKGTTAQGVRYKSRESRKSGSATTTDGNTHCSGGVTYCALREMGFSPANAWEMLGLYGGDDSIDLEMDGAADANKKAYGNHGLILKFCKSVPRGRPVDFYGRYFIDPWTSLDSFADPWRTIGKLGSTVAQGDLLSAAVNKARGYIATDLATPVIGMWALKLTSFGDGNEAQMTKEERFKLSQAWPQKDVGAIRAAFLEVSGLDADRLELMEAQIDACECLDDFNNVVPLDNEHLVEHDPSYVVEGEFFAAPGPKSKDTQPKPNVRKATVKEGGAQGRQPRKTKPVRDQHDHAGLEGSSTAGGTSDDGEPKRHHGQKPGDNRGPDDRRPLRREVRGGRNSVRSPDRRRGTPDSQFVAREAGQPLRSLEATQDESGIPAAANDRKRGGGGNLVRPGPRRPGSNNVRDSERKQRSRGGPGVRTVVRDGGNGPAGPSSPVPHVEREHPSIDGSRMSGPDNGRLDGRSDLSNSNSDPRVPVAGVRGADVGSLEHRDVKTRRKPRGKKGKAPSTE